MTKRLLFGIGWLFLAALLGIISLRATEMLLDSVALWAAGVCVAGFAGFMVSGAAVSAKTGGSEGQQLDHAE